MVVVRREASSDAGCVMSEDFTWKTEDDYHTWRSLEPEPEPEPPSKRWGRRLLVITAVLLLTCFVGAIAYSQLSRKATTVTNQLADDVIGVHQLVLETAVHRDTDLFQTFVNHPSGKWGRNQTELVARDLYLNRAPLGLWVDTGQIVTQTLTIPEVTTYFSPDLRFVEIQVEQPYLTRAADDALEPILLVQTAVYQQQDASWLLTVPDSTFWGDDSRAESSILTLYYPARDAQVAEKLAADLNHLLVTACAAELFPCPHNLAVDLTLETDESSLLALNRRFRLDAKYSTQYGRRYALSLPTPTLVGLPVDEAGYEALVRGYGAQLLAAMVVNLHPDFDRGFPNQNILSQQLSGMHLPMPEPVGFHPAETAVPPPISLPDQNILAFCRDHNPPLVHYDLKMDKWTPVLVDGFVYGLIGLGNGDGVLLSVTTEAGNQIRWWQPDRETILVDQGQNLYVGSTFLYPGGDEADRYAINFYEGPRGIPAWRLLDESNCTENACELLVIDQWPLVSPDGRFRLMIGLDENRWTRQISLEDAAGELRTSFGHGFNPVWLNDEEFAYIRAADSSLNVYPAQTTLVKVNVTQTSNNITEITPADISASFNNIVPPDDLLIGGLLPGPDGQWLLLVHSPGPLQLSLTYLIAYAPATGRMALYENLREFETAVFLSNSPDNRHFLIAVLEQSGVAMRLYDVQQNQYRSYAVPSAWRGRYDWSANSDWLLILEEDGVRLVAPAYDYERRIVHDYLGCETAVWVNAR